MSAGPGSDSSGMRLLASAAVDLIGAQTSADAVRAVFRHLAPHLDLDVFALHIVDSRGRDALLDAHEGIDDETVRSLPRLPVDQDRPCIDGAICATYPLTGRSGLLGWLTFGTRRRTRLTTNDLELMRHLSAHVAVAVDRIRAHQRLRESEQRVRATFDNAGVGLVEVDTNDRLIDVNERVCAILGYRREELIGITIHDLTAPEDRALSDRLNQELHEGIRERVRYEKRYLKRDGSPVWVHVTVSPIRDDAGRWLRSIATIEDITERKAAEVALRKAERQLRHHMDNSPLAIVELGADGHVTRWSGSSEQLFGWTAAEMIGRSFSQWPFVHEGDWPAFDAAMKDLLDGNAARSVITARHYRRDGGIVNCEWYNSAWTDEDGKRSMLSRVLDVTARERAERDRRRSERARAESERRFRELADAMPQIVWTADATGQVDYYNQRWVEFTGLTAAEGHGQGWAPVVHPDDQQATLDAWTHALSTGRTYQVEHRIRRGDGSFRWLLSRGVPVTDASGQTRWYGTATDIHAQKQSEETLRESDRRKDEFLATLAHELRNPLAPIRFAVKLLEQARIDDAGVERSRQVIERQTAHLVRLVDDLLDVSRITRNKIQLRRERVRLRSLMNTAVESTEPQMKAAGHSLHVRIEGDPTIVADAARVVQVFTNLLNNAVKFTPPGGSIAFSASQSGEDVLVTVRDSGVGIAPDALPRVFDMFHQADNSLDRAAGGLGIGLTLSRRLVEMHGGTLEAASEGTDRGAEFSIRFPALGVPAAVDSSPAVDFGETAEARTLRVLIVDDNVDSAEMLALVAGLKGHDTRIVHDGYAALTAYEEFRPQVVLLDIGLPGLNGYEVARAVRAQYGNTSSLVAITGWGQEEDRRRAREAGFDCHMTKPADPDVLERLLAAFSAGEHCSACNRCLHTPMTRRGDFLSVGSTAAVAREAAPGKPAA